MTSPVLSAVRDEAVALRALLTAEVPRYAASRRDVDPSALARAPSCLAALWEQLGWSPLFGWTELLPPDLDHDAQLRARLAEYAHHDPRWSITRADLPPRARLLHEDSQGLGFTFSDDDDDTNDPPLHGVVTERRTLIGPRRGAGVLRYTANRVLSRALRPWYQTRIRLGPRRDLPKATAPLPTVCPAARTLGDDLWLLPAADTSVAVGKPGGDLLVAHRRFETFVDWLLARTIDTLELRSVPPGERAVLQRRPDLDALPSGLRFIPGATPDQGVVIGRLDGEAVLVSLLGRGCAVAINPAHRAALPKIQRSLGLG